MKGGRSAGLSCCSSACICIKLLQLSHCPFPKLSSLKRHFIFFSSQTIMILILKPFQSSLSSSTELWRLLKPVLLLGIESIASASHQGLKIHLFRKKINYVLLFSLSAYYRVFLVPIKPIHDKPTQAENTNDNKVRGLFTIITGFLCSVCLYGM